MKAAALATCVERAVQRVAYTPRLAPGEDWSTMLITTGLAIVVAAIVALRLASLENARPPRRRFT